MQTPVSRDSYAEIEEKFWRRAFKVVAVMFGSVMCLASIIQQASVLGFGLSLSIGLIMGLVAGTGFGWLWVWAMRRSSRKHFDKVYAGDSEVIGRVPKHGEYAYRIPSGLFVTNNVTVGGVLYLGRAGMEFVPHKRYRGERNIQLERESLVVWVVDWKPNWWGRTFVASGPRILEVSSGDNRYRFAFPEVDVVLPRIRRALGQQG